MSKRSKYGRRWDLDVDDAQIERGMLREGGRWVENGQEYGLGLFEHFKRYWALLWPDDSQTKWTDLILDRILKNKFLGLIGPASSWKTGTAARIALMDWSLFPECTMVLMSSTDMEGLRSRVYGETAKMWGIAKDKYDWFPGHPIDHKCVIAHDDIDEDVIRDLRNGIIGVPNKTPDGKVQGLGKFAGRKNTRVWSVCDETQFCERSFLDAQNNLSRNGPCLLPGFKRDENGAPLLNSLGNRMPLNGYRGVFLGNPNPTRPENCLHLVCEPEGSWGAVQDDRKTKTWIAKRVPNSVVSAEVISLDGYDGPNSDFPDDKPRWENLVSKKGIAEYQPESESYWTQGRGIVKLGLAGLKIITKEICDQFHAFDQLIWDGATPTTKIGMIDAAYGGVGGDRCALGWLEFGKCLDGVIRILVHPWILVPVRILKDVIPEDQIAVFAKSQMEAAGVLPENFFFDGRGSMAISFSRLWSPKVNAVEFGGKPTDRPVGPDIYINDPLKRVRRLKLAVEHYTNFVAELWWSSRYTIESDQIRGLTLDIVMDGQPREWHKMKGDKTAIETKYEMRKRTGCSPDLWDMIVVGIEGARRRGFQIAKLRAIEKPDKKKPDYLDTFVKNHSKMMQSKELKAA